MNNEYTIIKIDPVTGAVYAHFEYNGHLLDHTIFPSNLTDSNSIIADLDSHYSDFTTHMDTLDNKPNLTPAVLALVGTNVTQAQVIASLKAVPVETPVQPLPEPLVGLNNS